MGLLQHRVRAGATPTPGTCCSAWWSNGPPGAPGTRRCSGGSSGRSASPAPSARATRRPCPGRTPRATSASRPTGHPVDVTEQVGLGTNGEAGLVSTTADLDRFFRALLGGRLLPPAQLAEMRRTVSLAGADAELMPDAADGLGLFSRSLPCGGAYWGHEGGGSGWITASGATADGRSAVTVSMSGVLADSAEAVGWLAEAEHGLVGAALCTP
ncbi:serine hydrolase [Kitasatospora phosalacinea]|uniref:serine hydrolase n=1 Tax=Kitasatospora phosalacinea TaxID=2065 RepID=UPI00365EDB79